MYVYYYGFSFSVCFRDDLATMVDAYNHRLAQGVGRLGERAHFLDLEPAFHHHLLDYLWLVTLNINQCEI